MKGLERDKSCMLWSWKVQLINFGVTSTALPYGNAVVNRIAVLDFPSFLLNVTVSNLKHENAK